MLPLALLMSGLLTGCSDSHSDDFVDFDDLERSAVSTDSETSDAPQESGDLEDKASEGSVDVDPVSLTTESGLIPPKDEQNAAAPEPDVAIEVITDSPNGKPVETPAEERPDSEALPITLLIPHRQFRKEGNAIRASFDDIDLLKILNMAPVPTDAADHFPDWLQALDGEHVRVRGYMRPGFEAEDITEFLFVRDNGACCYGPRPKIYDMIAVELKDGQSTDWIEDTPFDVEGTFRIESHVDEVELYGLFFIDDGVIIE